jgi:hypothetical protein
MSRALVAAIAGGILLLSVNVVEAVSSTSPPASGQYTSPQHVSFTIDGDHVKHFKAGGSEVFASVALTHGSDGWRFDYRGHSTTAFGRSADGHTFHGSYGPSNDRRTRHTYTATLASRARAAGACPDPGVIKNVVVHTVTETHIGCHAADVGIRHYFFYGTPPGYLCTKVRLGSIDHRLVCDRYAGGGFVAHYREL